MASPLVSRTPQCLSCIRRINVFGEPLTTPSVQQIRGKKKLAKVSTIKVQLIRNVPGYGKKGSIIPIAPGVMRNIWYPKKMAGYMTVAKLAEMNERDDTFERDSTFGTREERKLARSLKTQAPSVDTPRSIVPAPPRKESSLPTAPYEARPSIEFIDEGPILEKPKSEIVRQPVTKVREPVPELEQPASVLARLLPPNVDFYRVPTPVTPATPSRKKSKSLPASAAVSFAAEAAAAERAAKEKAITEGVSVDESVTTHDVAASLNAFLAEDVHGKLVHLSHENISFIGTESQDGVMSLGTFEVEIRLEGADAVRRQVNIKAH